MKVNAVDVSIAHAKFVREMRNEAEKWHRAILYEDFESIVVGDAHTAKVRDCARCEKSGSK